MPSKPPNGNQNRAIISYIVVGVLWGCTNPFIKYAQNAVANRKKSLSVSKSSSSNETLSSGAASSSSTSLSSSSSSSSSLDTDKEKVSDTVDGNMFSNIINLFKEPSILAPFAINQLGSLAFYYVLINEPISIAAPVCNSLTFILTALVSHFYLGEDIPNPSFLVMGIIAIVTGIYICITSSSGG